MSFGVMVGLIFILAMDGPAWSQSLGIGNPMPEFALTDLAGNTHRLSQYRRNGVLVNFWATWCVPCRLEMPSMEQVYRARKGHGLVILAVNLDTGPRSMVEAFVKELELTFPILLDPRGASARTYQVLGLPTSYLIDRDGRLVRQELGPRNWSLGEARAKLEALLK